MDNIRKIFSFFCLTFFLAPFYLFSQPKDTVPVKNDSLKISAIYESGFDSKDFEKNFFEIDTSLAGFHKKENFYNEHLFYARSSTPGAAERSLLFQADHDFDQISSLRYFRHYFNDNSNAKYYYALSPYSNAFYMMGPKREQLFDFLFTRNFGDLMNTSVDYYLLYSPGIYQYKKSNDNFVSVTSNFHSKSKRYLAIVNYFYNRMKVQENGGIRYDSSFTQNCEPNRERIDVNLYAAENKVKESGIYFRQFYFPGLNKNRKDTIKGNERYIAFGRFSYSLLFKNIEEVYYDEDLFSGFYQNVYIDSTVTHDSLQVNFIENKIEWSNLRFNIDDSVEQHFLFKIGAKYLKQHIYGINWEFDLGSVIPEASCRITLNPVQINISGFYVAGGYNADDYSYSASADYHLDMAQTKVLGLGALLISQTPSWFDQNFFSNYFYWIRDFSKTATNKIFLHYISKDFSAQVNLFNIRNPVYFDTTALPEQLQGSDRILQLSVKKNFKWKKWNFDNDIVYQKISGTDVIRLPEFISDHSLYYSDNLIKNVLSAQIGTEVTFFSSYYPLAYMPATKEFYLQNEYKSSSYPYIDFFMNLKIKRIRIFLKLDHLNSGMMGYDYFMIPHYPMADRSLKFGLSWIFYN